LTNECRRLEIVRRRFAFQDGRSYIHRVPRQRRSNDSREALLEEGIRLLSTQGYHGTGIKEILDAVSVPKGSFYNYFESKEAFVAAIIHRYVAELLGRLDAYIARSKKDPVTLLKSAYGHMLDEMERDGAIRGCLVGSMAAEVGSSSPLCQAELRRAIDQWNERVVTLFRRAQAEGQLRGDVRAEDMASVLWNAWEGGLLRMKVEGDASSAKQALHLLLDHLFAPTPRR
jgi:TetR/AcrR family transcriptional repressor of nem operon